MRTMNHARRDLRGTAVGLLLVGVLLVVVNAIGLRHSMVLMRHGRPTMGRVSHVEWRSAGRRRSRRVQYATITMYGEVTGSCIVSGHEYAIGQPVAMIARPDDPSFCSVNSVRDLFGLPGVGFVIGAALVLVSLAVYERERRKASR